MRASSTGSSDDKLADDGRPAGSQPKGFRKRWADKAASLPSDVESNALSSEAFQDFDDAASKPPKKSKSDFFSNAVEVVDKTVDEFVGEPILPRPPGPRHHFLEKEALLGTNLNVFKYPWELSQDIHCSTFGTTAFFEIAAGW